MSPIGLPSDFVTKTPERAVIFGASEDGPPSLAVSGRSTAGGSGGPYCFFLSASFESGTLTFLLSLSRRSPPSFRSLSVLLLGAAPVGVSGFFVSESRFPRVFLVQMENAHDALHFGPVAVRGRIGPDVLRIVQVVVLHHFDGSNRRWRFLARRSGRSPLQRNGSSLDRDEDRRRRERNQNDLGLDGGAEKHPEAQCNQRSHRGSRSCSASAAVSDDVGQNIV